MRTIFLQKTDRFLLTNIKGIQAQRIRKVLVVSNFDYEGTTARKDHSDKYSRIFFGEGIRLNMKAYIKWLAEVMLPRLKMASAERPYVRQ